MNKLKRKKLNSARYITYIALCTALLIGGQYALSFVSGIEIVTVSLLCFSSYFGVSCGVLCAVCFSLLRNVIWGIYPPVLVLYLIYYPLFALCFGLLGKVKNSSFNEAKIWLFIAVNALLAALSAAGFCLAAFNVIKISALYANTVKVLLYIISSLCAVMLIAFNVIFILAKKNIFCGGKILKLFLFTATATAFTVCFTLLDDIISPLMLGLSKSASLTYFYASFIAMLPQAVCTVATVTVLYYPITAALTKACKKPVIY